MFEELFAGIFEQPLILLFKGQIGVADHGSGNAFKGLFDFINLIVAELIQGTYGLT